MNETKIGYIKETLNIKTEEEIFGINKIPVIRWDKILEITKNKNKVIDHYKSIGKRLDHFTKNNSCGESDQDELSSISVDHDWMSREYQDLDDDVDLVMKHIEEMEKSLDEWKALCMSLLEEKDLREVLDYSNKGLSESDIAQYERYMKLKELNKK